MRDNPKIIEPHLNIILYINRKSVDVIEKRNLIYGYDAKKIEELQLKISNLQYLSQKLLYDFTIIDNSCIQSFFD